MVQTGITQNYGSGFLFVCLFFYTAPVVDTVVVRALLSQITSMDGKVFLDGGIIQTSFMTVLLLYYNFGAQV